METSVKNNSKRVANQVNNRVMFSDGYERRPEYAILLPNGHSVLCRAGRALGTSAFISRKEANKKGIEYLKPMKWEYSNLYLYSNKEVRDEKGKYVGRYLGYQQDNFSDVVLSFSSFGGTLHDFFLLKEEKIMQVDSFGNMEQIDAETLASQRLHWSSSDNIAGKNYANSEDYMSIIRRLALEHPMALKAALELQKLTPRQTMDNGLDEEAPKRAKKVTRQRMEAAEKPFFIPMDEEA